MDKDRPGVDAVGRLRRDVVGSRVGDESHRQEDQKKIYCAIIHSVVVAWSAGGARTPNRRVRDNAEVLKAADLAEEHAYEGPDNYTDGEANTVLGDFRE